MPGCYLKTKKALKELVGQPTGNCQFVETSVFGPEIERDGAFCVVGPDPYNSRKWYAEVTVQNGVVVKVS